MTKKKTNKIDMRGIIKETAQKNGINEEAVIEALKVGYMAGWRTYHNKREQYHLPQRVADIKFKDDKFFIDDKGHIVAIVACKVVAFDDKEFDPKYTPLVPPKKDDYITTNPSKKEPEKKVGEVFYEEIDIQDFSINARKEFHKKYNEMIKLSLSSNLSDYYKEKIGTLISANVIETGPKGLKISLGNEVESFLGLKQLLTKDRYAVGDRIKVLITGVTLEEKGYIKVSVTRNDSRMVEALYEDEYGTIKDVVEFYKVVYEQGSVDDTNRYNFGKCKVCVKRKNPNVDPVSTLIGNSGERSKKISQLLGLQLEIFEYSDNISEFIGRALKPANIKNVFGINDKEKKARVIVEDTQYSLAIGKGGVNARLAHEATGWGIDIKSISEATEEGIIF